MSLNHASLQGLGDRCRLATNVASLWIVIKLLLDVSEVLFDGKHVRKEHLILPVDLVLAKAIVKVGISMRNRVESGDGGARWRAGRVVTVLHLQYRLIVETAFRKGKQWLCWGLSGSRLGSLLYLVVFFKEFLYWSVPILGPNHWGLFTIYHFFNYLISVGLHWRCDFRSSLIVCIDIVHVKIETCSILTSAAPSIFNRDSCSPDLLDATEWIYTWS